LYDGCVRHDAVQVDLTVYDTGNYSGSLADSCSSLAAEHLLERLGRVIAVQPGGVNKAPVHLIQ